jgi:2-keto-4-pentenoate hydratase
VLGHPLNAVLWLVPNGVRLQPGDLVSVGSFGPLAPAKPGEVTAHYDGLPGDPTVSVTLE